MYISKERNKTMREVSREYGAEMGMDSEEEVDVEEVIAKAESELGDFISSDTQDRFEEIFDAARRSYADPEVRRDWDLLFTNLKSELMGAEDEDDVESIVRNYTNKANALS